MFRFITKINNKIKLLINVLGLDKTVYLVNRPSPSFMSKSLNYIFDCKGNRFFNVGI